MNNFYSFLIVVLLCNEVFGQYNQYQQQLFNQQQPQYNQYQLQQQQQQQPPLDQSKILGSIAQNNAQNYPNNAPTVAPTEAMRKKKDWMGQDLINQNNINYGSWNKDWDNINKWYTTQVPPETRPQWQNWQGNLNGYPYWPNQNGFNSEFNNGFNGCFSSPCLNNGYCTPSGKYSYRCACAFTWYGTKCEFRDQGALIAVVLGTILPFIALILGCALFYYCCCWKRKNPREC